VLDVMVKLTKEGMTMICVTYEMGFARAAADKVIFMAEGDIVKPSAREAFSQAKQSAPNIPVTTKKKSFFQKLLGR
jgi:glutamate transport system ATP-binding protein